MTQTQAPLISLSEPDGEDLHAVEALAARGAEGVPGLLARLDTPRWTVRRAVVAALAQAGLAAAAPLCDVLACHRDNEARIAGAVDALVTLVGDAVQVERMVTERLADHANPAVLYDAAQILGRRKSRAAIPVLAQLTGHADDNVAVAAIEALGRIGGSSAMGALTASALSGNFFRTFPAIDVLGRSGDARAVPTLRTLLGHPVYALDAARALGRTGHPDALLPLLEFLQKGNPGMLRVAATALAEIDEAAGPPRLSARPVVDALRALDPTLNTGRRLVQAFADADAQERLALTRVMGWMGGDDAVQRLIENLDAEPGLARATATALADLGERAEPYLLSALREGESARRMLLLPRIVRRSSSVPDVVACLVDPDASVRTLACDTLAKLGDVSAVPALFERLADLDPRVSQAAVGALQSLGSADTERRTLAAADAVNPQVRRAALRMISYFGYSGGLPALLRAISDPEERLRDAAMQGLAFIEEPAALEALLESTRHPSAKTRAAAVRALGQTARSVEVTRVLLAALEDADAWVRYYACQSLGKLGEQTAVDAIIARMEDPAGQVSVAAVEALSHLSTPRSLEALRRAVQSSNSDMQRAALLGLGLTQDVTLLPTLVQALQSEDAATRLVAVSAISGFEETDATHALARAAEDADSGVRNAAVGFLGRRKDLESVEALGTLARDSARQDELLEALVQQVEGRTGALVATLKISKGESLRFLVRAVLHLEPSEALAAVLDVLTTGEAPARREVASALGSTGLRGGHAALEQAAASDPDAGVREVCRQALER